MTALNRVRRSLRRVRRVVRRKAPRVFRVRRWQPDERPARPGDGRPKLDLLWRDAPPHWRRVVIDASMEERPNYPAGVSPLPLIDVHTQAGDLYLSIALCPRTGLVFHRLLPSAEWQRGFYATEWDHASDTGTFPAIAELAARRGDKVHTIVGHRLKPGSRVLDVGCGYGDQLFFFEHAGHVCAGIEPSERRAQYAAGALKGTVRHAPIEGGDALDALAREGLFDLVYLNQVLEHLSDARSVAAQLRKVIAPGGVLMLGTPDLYSESLVGYSGSIVHTQAFTTSSMKNVLALAGYRFVEDLSFPGYVYLLFTPAPEGETPALQTPDLAGAARYACDHFDLLDPGLSEGAVLSVVSDYTGASNTGFRVANRGDQRALASAVASLRSGRVEDARDVFPILIATSFEHPTVWLK